MGESFVIDNSVVMSWCFRDEVTQYADTVLDRLQESTAFVPSIWPLEVVNVLLVAERYEKGGRCKKNKFPPDLGTEVSRVVGLTESEGCSGNPMVQGHVVEVPWF